jgi:hypothetical protein
MKNKSLKDYKKLSCYAQREGFGDMACRRKNKDFRFADAGASGIFKDFR